MLTTLETQEHGYINPRDAVRKFTAKDCERADLQQIMRSFGIGLDESDLRLIAEKSGFGMDSNFVQGLTTNASIAVPVQFLQNWLPGFVNVIFNVRNIDELVGISTQGEWFDEEIVQGVLETTGTAVPYGDYSNTNFSDWNVNFIKRTIVNFESGMRVGRKEESRASKIRLNSSDSKRLGCTTALEVQRNAVGFYGYNGGANLTYGFLTDPSLLPYNTAAATGTGSTTTWSTKTFLNIVGDLLTAISGLRTQSGDNVDPKKVDMTLAVASDAVDYLSTVSDFGISVMNWLNTNYPKIRVCNAPELNLANGGQNVFYLYAETVDDASTDDRRTFIQVVPTKFQLNGVAQLAKGYEESYLNATAGVMVKRPYAVYRVTGI